MTGVAVKRRSLDDYLRHIERFGSDGVLDAAAADLDEPALAELRQRLGQSNTIQCATPGCLVVFIPARKGQRYHSSACRQKAHRHRTRRGQEAAEGQGSRVRGDGRGVGPAERDSRDREAEQVADSATLSSLQPRRVRVLERVAAILERAPIHEPSGLPVGFSYFRLACDIYATTKPTAAQLSAVRRAVARLVATGRAEVDRDRDSLQWGERGTHRRRSRQNPRYRFEYFNPAGVTIRRVPTDADREARAAAYAEFRRGWASSPLNRQRSQPAR
jgi:hypothetical protein